MTDLFAGWRFALRRLRTGWRFMAVAAFGVLVASTLLAITPIYAAAMSDLGLAFRLGRELDEPRDSLAYLSVDGLSFGSPVARARGEVMDQITDARLGWLGEGVIAEDRTQRLNISFPGVDPPEEPVEVVPGSDLVRQPWGGFVYHLAGWAEHVELVDGRLPDGSSSTPEAVLPDGFQRHAALGDTVLVQAGGYDDCPDIPPSEDATQAQEEVLCEPTATTSLSLRVTIVGFVRPTDLDDPRWGIFDGQWAAPDVPLIPRLRGVGAQDPRRAQAARGIGQMPLLISEEQLDRVFRSGLPELEFRHRSGVSVDTSRLGLGEVDAAIEEMELWLEDIRGGLGLTAPGQTAVLDTLRGFRTAQSFSAVPLLVVLLQVVGIVLYYVAMVMAMLLERQSEEIGVYRSRGANGTQLLGLSLVEGVVYAVPALLVAPWLAARVVAILGATPAFDNVTGGATLDATVTPEAYLLAVAGGALSLVAVLLPALFVVRRGIVDVKREQARPAERNVFQRYYLDFGLVALAGLLLWQLNQRGSVFDPGAVGGWSTDPLLLLAPIAITAAVSLMVLRFYPPLVRLVVRILLVFRGTATAIGLRRAGRAPASYARVALLVIMAVAVGTFAASYGPTVALSLADRVRYEDGVDLRGPLVDVDTDIDAQIATLQQMPGVLSASGIYRGQIQSPSGATVPLLAIDPALAERALWWRDDFAARDLRELMRVLQSDIPPGGGYPLPEDTQAIEVLLYSSIPERASFVARFRDADGRIHDTLMQVNPAPDTWLTGRAPMPRFGTPPFVFAGFMVSDRPAQSLRSDGDLSIDNLRAVRLNGDRVLLDDFEGPMRWMILNGVDASETFAPNPNLGFNEGQSLTWTWSSTISTRQRMLAPGDPAVPLSTIMNGPAMGAFMTGEGGTAVAEFDQLLIPLSVRASVDLFPTLLPERGIVIVNIEHLRAVADLVDAAPYQLPNEVWADLDPAMSLTAQRELLLSSQGGSTENTAPRLGAGSTLLATDVDGIDRDPTLQAAGSAILGVAFVAVLALCTVGFVVTMVTGARSRATEFAVLRALGTSRGEILRALIMEWAVVLVAGAVIGALVGRQVARIMLGFLNVTEEGDPVLPPFELRTDWVTLAVGLGTLVLVVGVSLVVAWVISMRRAPTGELRLTQ